MSDGSTRAIGANARDASCESIVKTAGGIVQVNKSPFPGGGTSPDKKTRWEAVCLTCKSNTVGSTASMDRVPFECSRLGSGDIFERGRTGASEPTSGQTLLCNGFSHGKRPVPGTSHTAMYKQTCMMVCCVGARSGKSKIPYDSVVGNRGDVMYTLFFSS